MKFSAKTILFASALGLLNSGYLTALFLTDKWGQVEKSFCDINTQLSCTNVITSPYAQFFGVPVCTIALLVYPVLIVLAWMALKRAKTRNLFYAIGLLSSAGLMLNLVYIYNEIVYIKSICALCILCSLFILTDLVMSIRGYSKSKA